MRVSSFLLALLLVSSAAQADFPPEYGDSLTGTETLPAIRHPRSKTIPSKRYPEGAHEKYQEKIKADPEVRYEFHMVKMKDGAELATHVNLPSKGDGPWPVIFLRGPYGALNYTSLFGKVTAQKDWVFISQDMRGRWHSPGSDAVVFMNDGWGKNRDAHETIEWIAAQPWCNGNVVSWGGSALGVTQVMAAPGAPKALKAQFVGQAFSDYYLHAAYQGGCFREALLAGWLEDNRFDPENLATIVEHSTYDDFWQNGNALAQAHRVNAPAVFAGAWHDIFSQGTLDSFTQIHNTGGPGARGRCKLIMSPGGHAGLSKQMFPDVEGGDLESANFGKFLDFHGKGILNGVENEKAVHYFVMGDSKDPEAPGSFWRHQDNWPPSANVRNFYLQPEGKLSNQKPKEEQGSATYKYDPAHPVPTIGGNEMQLAAGPFDQRPVEGRDDILLFTTEPLTEPLEVTGRISAELFVSSDRPDTDFAVKITDVYPDGTSSHVVDGIMKARFRRGYDREVLLTPDKIERVPVDLWSTSWIFAPGHRIRVAVTSSNWPRFHPNPNNGKKFKFHDPDRHVATNTIHLSPSHPSSINLPIYAGPTNEDPKEPWGRRLKKKEESKAK